MNKALKNTWRFFEPVWGNALWWVIIVVSLVLTKLDCFDLKGRMEDWIVQIIYDAISILGSFSAVFLIFSPILKKIVGYLGIGDYFGTQPNIKMVEASVYEGYTVFSDNSIAAGTLLYHPPDQPPAATWQIEKNYFAHVVFENRKRRCSIHTETAEQVTAHIRFLGEYKKDLLNYDFIGRWGNYMQQPRDVFTVLGSPEYTSIDMRSDGTKYSLDIAMKNRDGSFMIAFNNKNYSGRYLLHRENIMSEKVVTVEVIINADNVDDDLIYYFELSHQGVGSILNIRQIENLP